MAGHDGARSSSSASASTPSRRRGRTSLLNGVLMGLSRREARGRFDAVLDFAELQDFADVKLKNYSSGMMVRLAFAIMVQADADIMLIDEVLAVGDAAFAQKCMDVFQERRRGGPDGRARHPRHGHGRVAVPPRAACSTTGSRSSSGTPNDAAQRYYGLNFADGARPGHNVDVVAASTRARARPAAARRSSLRRRAWTRAWTSPRAASFGARSCTSANNVTVATFVRAASARCRSGGRVRLEGELENRAGARPLQPRRLGAPRRRRRRRQRPGPAAARVRGRSGEPNGAGVLDLAGDGRRWWRG